MGQLQSNFDFTGKLGNISAYKRRDSDKIILRTKGGPTWNQMKTHPNFKRARQNSSEFGGRSTASKWVRRMLDPLPSVSDYNISGPLTAIIKPIQALDTDHDPGERDIFFSKDTSLLHGFNLNKRNTFDSIIRTPLSCNIDRANLTATVEIPQLVPTINFFNPGKHAFFSIIVVIGVLPDLFYSKDGYTSKWENEEYYWGTPIASEWFSSLEGSKPFTLSAKYSLIVPNQSFALMLSVGIKFGTMGIGGSIQQVPHAGAAKIITTA